LLDTVRIVCSGVVGGDSIKSKKSHRERLREEQKAMSMDRILERAKERIIEKQGIEYQEVQMTDELRAKSLAAFADHEIKEGNSRTETVKYNYFCKPLCYKSENC